MDIFINTIEPNIFVFPVHLNGTIIFLAVYFDFRLQENDQIWGDCIVPVLE